MTVRVAFGGRGNWIGEALGAIAFAALAAAPWWGGRDDLQLLSEIYAYVVLASLWNLLAGYAGLVSVGQQAYVGLGAYSLFALTILFGVSPLWSIPLAGLIAAGLSIPVALLVFRLRGHYFAIGTWIVAEVFRLPLRKSPRSAAVLARACPPPWSSPSRRRVSFATSPCTGLRFSLPRRCWR